MSGSHSRQGNATRPSFSISRTGIVDEEEIVKKTVTSREFGKNSSVAISIVFFPNLFSGTLSRQGLLHSALRARLQVEGVTLHFLDDVFRLHLALEPPQCVFNRLAFLQSNFCQIIASKLKPHIRAYAIRGKTPSVVSRLVPK
jgi:hypothetical protein